MEGAVTVNSRHFDGSIGKSWTCKLLKCDGPLLIFVGIFDQEIIHEHLGVIRRGTISYEYYWLDRWYNVFRFHQPDGALRNYYCNINSPPTFEDGVLDYVDLDLDVLVNEDWSYSVLDRDEFEENALRYGYSSKLRTRVSEGLNDLIQLIQKREFPFNR